MNSPLNDPLEPLLADWAASHRLDQRSADDIRDAIVGEGRASLPATWWSDLSAQVTAAVVLASARPGWVAGSNRVVGGLAVA